MKIDANAISGPFCFKPRWLLGFSRFGPLGTPTSAWPKKRKNGPILGVFWAAAPLFIPLWPRFGPKMGHFRPIFGSPTWRMANLLASQAPFWALDLRPPKFHRLRVGGRQLLHFGVSRGPFLTPKCRFGTHDRLTAYILGRPRPRLRIWSSRPAHFSETPPRICWLGGPPFRARDFECPELHGLRPRG
jgi:hypothetical protein